jgi:hypothetical protein
MENFPGLRKETKVSPRIGQRVMLTSLVWGSGPFPGQIVGIGFTGLCLVKLDKQDRPVANVKFFAEPPDVVDGRYWQICYPEEEDQDGEMSRVRE